MLRHATPTTITRLQSILKWQNRRCISTCHHLIKRGNRKNIKNRKNPWNLSIHRNQSNLSNQVNRTIWQNPAHLRFLRFLTIFRDLLCLAHSGMISANRCLPAHIRHIRGGLPQVWSVMVRNVSVSTMSCRAIMISRRVSACGLPMRIMMRLASNCRLITMR